MAKVEVKVDLIRQPLLDPKLEFPRVLLLKDKSSESYLPVYVSKRQGDFIQKLLLDDDPIQLESVLDDLALPAEQMSKGTLESIEIEPVVGNKFQAKLILYSNDKNGSDFQVDLPVGNAIALSFIAKVPVFVEESMLINTHKSYSYS